MTELKRYSEASRPYMDGCILERDDDGDWVRFEDVEVQLAEKEKRIKELEKQRRSEAIDGQCAMDEAYNRIKELEEENTQMRDYIDEMQGNYGNELTKQS